MIGTKLLLAVMAVGTSAGVGAYSFTGTCGDAAKSCTADASTVAVKAEGSCGDKAASCGDKAVKDQLVSAKTADGSCGDKAASCGDKAAKETLVSTKTEGKADDGHKHTADCGHAADLVAVLAKHDKHTTLAGLIKSSGLDKELAPSADRKLTILAPTDEAFSKLSESQLESLTKPENKASLRLILVGHVLEGSTTTCCLKDGGVVKAVNGRELKVASKDGKTSIAGATVLASDTTATNGVIHSIDTVILPDAPSGQ